MVHKECSLLVCGATFTGLGAAAARARAGETAIVVERTALVGREFIDAINPGRDYRMPQTDLGRKFRNECLKRNLIGEDGPAHLPGLHPLLCSLIKTDGLNVRFLTEIVDIAEQNGKFRALLFDAAGFTTIIADEILDTSSERLTRPGRLFTPPGKRLNAYLHCSSEQPSPLPAPIDDAMSLATGRFPSEIILKLSVPPHANWPEARQRLHQYWASRPAEWAPWTISVSAGTFESDVPRGAQRLAERWTWLPSEGFGNPLEAFDQGCAHRQLAAESASPNEKSSVEGIRDEAHAHR
jgi:hypothetical protein